MQAKEILNKFPQFSWELIKIDTSGDKDKLSRLIEKEESSFFTDQIENALIRGEVDLAIHSAKDVEKTIPQELLIAVLTEAENPLEALVAKGGYTLRDLPFASTIGVSSLRRKEQLLSFRPDFLTKDIRGNIEERISQLDSGKYDALIIALAALIRLGLKHRASQIIPAEIIRPHPLQGRLAVQVRRDNLKLINIFKGI